MSKGQPLTVDFIMSKTKADSLQSIKNLNLWGNNLDVHIHSLLGFENTILNAESICVESECQPYQHAQGLQQLQSTVGNGNWKLGVVSEKK
jgi:hypothetical protein